MAQQHEIWTLGRLAGALALAVVGYIAATRLTIAWPDPMLFGNFQLVSAALGFVLGWRVIGIRLGYGTLTGLTAGVTAAALLCVLGFIVFSLYVSISRNMSMGNIAPDVVMGRYLSLVQVWARNMTDPVFWGLLIGGGALAGLIAELLTSKRG